MPDPIKPDPTTPIWRTSCAITRTPASEGAYDRRDVIARVLPLAAGARRRPRRGPRGTHRRIPAAASGRSRARGRADGRRARVPERRQRRRSRRSRDRPRGAVPRRRAADERNGAHAPSDPAHRIPDGGLPRDGGARTSRIRRWGVPNRAPPGGGCNPPPAVLLIGLPVQAIVAVLVAVAAHLLLRAAVAIADLLWAKPAWGAETLVAFESGPAPPRRPDRIGSPPGRAPPSFLVAA